MEVDRMAVPQVLFSFHFGNNCGWILSMQSSRVIRLLPAKTAILGCALIRAQGLQAGGIQVTINHEDFTVGCKFVGRHLTDFHLQ